MKCSKIKDWVESDDNSLSSLPTKLEEHATTCSACDSYLKAMGMIAGALTQVHLSAADIAKMKASVFEQVGMTTVTGSIASGSRTVTALSLKTIAATAAVAAVISIGIYKSSDQPDHVPVTNSAVQTQVSESPAESDCFFVTGENAEIKDLGKIGENRIWAAENSLIELSGTDAKVKIVFKDGGICNISGKGQVRVQKNSLQPISLTADLSVHRCEQPVTVVFPSIVLSLSDQKQKLSVDQPGKKVVVHEGQIEVTGITTQKTVKLQRGDALDFSDNFRVFSPTSLPATVSESIDSAGAAQPQIVPVQPGEAGAAQPTDGF